MVRTRNIMNTPVMIARDRGNDGAVVELVLQRIFGELSGGASCLPANRIILRMRPQIDPIRQIAQKSIKKDAWMTWKRMEAVKTTPQSNDKSPRELDANFRQEGGK